MKAHRMLIEGASMIYDDLRELTQERHFGSSKMAQAVQYYCISHATKVDEDRDGLGALEVTEKGDAKQRSMTSDALRVSDFASNKTILKNIAPSFHIPRRMSIKYRYLGMYVRATAFEPSYS